MKSSTSSRVSLFFSFFGVALAALVYPCYLLAGAAGGRTAIAAGLGLGGGVAYALTLSLGRQVDELARAAKEIGEGDFERRLASHPGQFFGPLSAAINSMAASIGERRRLIAREQARILAVLDAMREGVMICDRRGRILSVNRAMRELFPDKAVYEGLTPIEVVSSPELQTACDDLLARNPGDAVPVGLTVESGRKMFLEVSLARLCEPEPGVVAVFHDLTLCRKLQNISRDLVANVTHELRTPLTSIKGYAETLLDDSGALPPQAARFVEVIKRNADHMTLMTADLLILSRIENDREPPVTTPTPLSRAVEESWRECAQLAKERNVEIDLRIEDAGPGDFALSADAGQLVQVLRNLIENAIRHGPAGAKVGVSGIRLGSLALVVVSDMGPGVPPADRQRVFERFYRVEKHRAKSGGGTGLGLAIAKHIVERHGGQIHVEPASGEFTGAAFQFTWPMAALQGEACDTDTV
ncbi:MAG: PAS domain-containing protein [Desulfovibrionaceae bacterium]|nr:PAS domain-containing protein [Desulfovibrionaceae bacterium]MBF0514121.1 PAS domain-containing protein [Desulfovibrionaceae bacterium]